jgi:homospermidine synthase
MSSRVTFGGRVIVLGYGTIGQCILPMLLETLDVPAERYVILEADDQGQRLAPQRQAGMIYRVSRITPDNLAECMASVAGPGDLVLNLTMGVDSLALADWCHRQGLLYVDTSIEPWEHVAWNFDLPPHRRTEYTYHQNARRQAAERWSPSGPTAIFTHGANPGLVSHFVKAALLDICAALERPTDPPTERRGWARLAHELGLKVIHISERDTQRSAEPKRVGEFVNTWSIPGFVEEASMPAEFGWGTHEKGLPAGAHRHADGPGNAIYVLKPAGQMLLRSWVPLGGQIAGLALPHSESITISDYLTVHENGKAAYRPTVAFAYLPCDGAMVSLHETIMQDWGLPERQRVMNEDILDGRDELGVLLLGHPLKGWWYGSQLDVRQARRLVPGNNPTAIQVAAGALAAAVWAVRNPRCGFREPEQLPHDEVLAVARPYLGSMTSEPTDWDPLAGRQNVLHGAGLDRDDPWQFANFLLA